MARIRSTTLVALALPIAAAMVAILAVGWELARPVPAYIGTPPAALAAAPVTFDSQSGSAIHGWLSRGWGRGAIVLFPGLRANRLSMVERAELLHVAGYSTLLIDFQGTGESPGDAITFGWRERLDVQAAVRFAAVRLPHEPIGVIGASLGGVATILAAPALNIQGAVLEGVYPTIDKAIVNRLAMRVGTLGKWLEPLLAWQLHPRLGVRPDDLRPVDHIDELDCPVLIIAGNRDEHTTVDDTRRLYAAANEPKELWVIDGAAHEDFEQVAPDAYRTRILAFFARALRSR
jgi:alpha-beta hydrolase superfamily lysophospholipase